MYDAVYALPPAMLEIAATPREIPLIAEVMEAAYDQMRREATIKISSPFDVRSRVKKYSGHYVTLIYAGHVVDIANCPVVKVPLQNVKQDFPNVFKNTVTLRIRQVPQDLADRIEDMKCLKVDTQTVRDIVDHHAPKPPKVPN